MRYKHVLQSLALGLLLVFMAACKGGGPDNPTDQPGPNAAVLDLDKGEVDLGQEVSVTFKVKNTGGQELSWSISNVADLKWLSFSATSGKVAVGAEFEITILVDKSKLAPGQNQLQVNVTADPGGTKTLTVKAFLAQAPVLADLTDAQVQEQTPISVKIQGQVTSIGTANITEHGHLWSLKAGQFLNNDGVKSTKFGALSAPKTFSSSLTGLKSNTVYYIRTYAINSVGTTYSKDFGFKTGNNLPSAIQLSKSLVKENSPVGTVVGTLTTTDADSDDKHTYILTAGAGSTDNDQFTITSNELKTAAVFDHETKKVYSIRIKSTDSNGGNREQAFTINIENVAEGSPPTDIKLSNHMVFEGEPISTVIGSLSAVDPDAGDTHTFTITGGATESFKLSNNIVLTKKVLDRNLIINSRANYLTHKNKGDPKRVQFLNVKATDQEGNSFGKSLPIVIRNRNAEEVEMIDIKGGTYGCNITVSDFQVSKYPITNAQFIKFLNWGGVNPDGTGDHFGYKFLDLPLCGAKMCIRMIVLSKSDIRHDGSKFVTDKPDAPVTGVTYFGSKGYANWAVGCRGCHANVRISAEIVKVSDKSFHVGLTYSEDANVRAIKAEMLTDAQLDYIRQLDNYGGVQNFDDHWYWVENTYGQNGVPQDPYPQCNTTDYRYINKGLDNTSGNVIRGTGVDPKNPSAYGRWVGDAYGRYYGLENLPKIGLRLVIMKK